MGNDKTEWQTGCISGQPPSHLAAGLDQTCLHKYKSVSRTLRVKTTYANSLSAL